MDNSEFVSRSVEFSTGSKETILDGLTGATVRVRANDRHENTRKKIAMELTNVWGSVANKIGDYASPGTARDIGLLSGFTVGAGGTARTVNAIVEDPLGFLDSFRQLAKLV